jgi:transketolase
MDAMKNIAAAIRKNVLFQIFHARSGHPGGSLSCVELLTYLYSREINSNNHARLVLSKGHAVPAWYAVAAEFGIIKKKYLVGFRKLGSMLQGHPHVLSTPWVSTSTGSLGQGFSVAVGIALGMRYQNYLDHTFVLLGDGELQEGEVWEAAMSASQFGLNTLCAIVDYNKLQSDDLNENIMGIEPLRSKWQAFGWNVVEVDGHDLNAIGGAINEARSVKNRPTVIIANTVKGKGVSFMEHAPLWHGSVTMKDSEFSEALLELKVPDSEISKYIDGSIWSEGA